MSYINCIILTAPYDWMITKICNRLIGGKKHINLNKLKYHFNDNSLKIKCDFQDFNIMFIVISSSVNSYIAKDLFNSILSLLDKCICNLQFKTFNKNTCITLMYRHNNERNNERIEKEFINGKCENTRILKEYIHPPSYEESLHM